MTTPTLRELCEQAWRDRIERETAIYFNFTVNKQNPLRGQYANAMYAYTQICWQFAHVISDAKYIVTEHHGDQYSTEDIVNELMAIAKAEHDKYLPQCSKQQVPVPFEA